jgi:hypothetical protein
LARAQFVPCCHSLEAKVCAQIGPTFPSYLLTNENR